MFADQWRQKTQQHPIYKFKSHPQLISTHAIKVYIDLWLSPRHHHYRANPIFFACYVSTIVQNKHQYGPTAALGGRILHFKTYTQYAVADGAIPDDVSKLLLLWMTPSWLRPKKKKKKNETQD